MTTTMITMMTCQVDVKCHWVASLQTCYLQDGKSYGVGDGTIDFFPRSRRRI